MIRHAAAPLYEAESALIDGLAELNARRSAEQEAADAEVGRIKRTTRRGAPKKGRHRDDNADAEADDLLGRLTEAMTTASAIEGPVTPGS